MKFTLASKDQLPIVRDLAYKIWPSTYGPILSQAQLDYMLGNFYSVECLEMQMVEKNQIFLLIQEDDVFLGYCSYELNINDSNKTKLHKIYVLPETQGKGVGNEMLKEVEKRTIAAGNSHLMLNVNRFNKALDFYKHKGFEVVEEVNIEIGEGYLMEDYIMEKKLV